MKPKIFDCFLFWKEFTALEIRLHELYDVVDKFVILEFSQSHTGLSKPFYLTQNLNLFSKFSEKLIIKTVDHKFSNSSPLEIAHNQRKVLDSVIRGLNPSQFDLILTSDSDEIVRASTLIEIKKQNLEYNNIAFELSLFHNYINNYMGEWLRPRLVTYKEFKGFSSSYRDIFIYQNYSLRRFKLNPLLRINPFFSASKFDTSIGVWRKPSTKNMTIIRDAGWHFTKLYPAEDHVEHSQSSPHIFEINQTINLESVRKRISENQTSYGGFKRGKIIKIDHTFPTYVQSNKIKLAEYISKE